MLRKTSVSLKEFLAGTPKRYYVNPFEYFAARLMSGPPIEMSNSLIVMAGTLSAFLGDEDLPAEYLEHFLATLYTYCVQERMPAAANVFFLLTILEKEHPLIQTTVAQWKDEGLYARLEALAEQQHESLCELLRSDAELASTVQMQHAMYLPPGMSDQRMLVVVGPQEQNRRAEAADQMSRGLDAEQRGDLRMARDYYARAAQLDPKDHEIALAHGQIHLRLDDPETAASLLRNLCTAVPESARFQSALGSALAAAERDQEALAVLDTALELDPTRAAAVANKAVVLNRLGRPTEAAKTLIGAFERQPSFQPGPEMVSGLRLNMLKVIVALLESSAVEVADQLAGHLCEFVPLDPLAWELRGKAAARCGRPGDALTYYARALVIDPTQDSAARACLSVPSAHRDEVSAIVRQYLDTTPADGNLWNDLGVFLSRSGDIAGAIKCFRQACRHAPDDPMHWMNLGSALITARESVAAMREGLGHIDEALRLKPSYVPGRFNRALGLFMLGALDAAREEVTEVLRADPSFPQAADLLAACGSLEGRRESRSVYSESDLADGQSVPPQLSDDGTI